MSLNRKSRKIPFLQSKVYDLKFVSPVPSHKNERHDEIYGPIERRGFNKFFCPCGTMMWPERWWHKILLWWNPFVLSREKFWHRFRWWRVRRERKFKKKYGGSFPAM